MNLPPDLFARIEASAREIAGRIERERAIARLPPWPAPRCAASDRMRRPDRNSSP